jgi:hypothetical protein
MKSQAAMNEFLTYARKLAISPKNRTIVKNLAAKANILLTDDLELQNPNMEVSEAQIGELMNHLNDVAIIKIVAKRIFRNHGYDF